MKILLLATLLIAFSTLITSDVPCLEPYITNLKGLYISYDAASTGDSTGYSSWLCNTGMQVLRTIPDDPTQHFSVNYTFNDAVVPHKIDFILTFDPSGGTGESFLGIYKFTAVNQFILAINLPGRPRPTNFNVADSVQSFTKILSG